MTKSLAEKFIDDIKKIVSYPITMKKARILNEDKTTVQASFIINQRFLKDHESKLIETVYSKLLKKYCFLASETTYLTPIKLTVVIYFKYLHANNKHDVFMNLGTGFGKDYLKMLDKAVALRNYLNTIKNEVRWFYYKNEYVNGFSYLNLFRKGETMKPYYTKKFPYKIRPSGTPIPTQEQLESLLIPKIFINRFDLLNKYSSWMEEQNISLIRDVLHLPYLITDFLQFFMFYMFNKYWDPKKKKWYGQKAKFEINEFLSLRLEGYKTNIYGGKTNIYVNDKRFDQCKFLLFNISNKERPNYKDIDSIDEASELYDRAHERDPSSLDPETEFWAHCSNLQAWYENNYDTRILHSNLSFPLLHELTKAGDSLAKSVFKDEIALRLESEYFPVFQYLMDLEYLDKNFTKEELKIISRNISHPILKIYLKHYFSFKQYEAHIRETYEEYRENKEIYISSNNFGIDQLILKEYSQEVIINLSDWKTSFSDILIYDANKYFYRFLSLPLDEKPIIGYIKKDLIKFLHEILGKNSKCVVSLIRSKTKFIPAQIEFFSIKKKIRIYLSLECPKGEC